MPKAYWITVYRAVNDPAKLAAYAKLASPATQAFGARYLCRGNAQAASSMAKRNASSSPNSRRCNRRSPARDSPAYQEAVRVLGDGAVRDVRMIEALE